MARLCSLRCRSGAAALMLVAAAAAAFVASTAAAALPNCTNPISFCPCRIADAGATYAIASADQDLLTNGGGGCIRIAAPNVTLSLGSATITSSVSSSDSIGIHVTSKAPGAVVEGAATGPALIQHFGIGIQVDAHGVTLRNLAAGSNGVGIRIDGSAAYGSALSAIGNTRVGILIKTGGAGPFLDGVSVSDTLGPGVELNGVRGAFIVNLTATANDTYGVWLRGSSRNVIADFIASQNTVAGVYLGCFRSGGLLSRPCDARWYAPPSNGNVIAGLDNPSSVDGPIQPNQEYGVVIGYGNHGNRVVDVAGSGNGTGVSGADAADYNSNCQGNVWQDNQFTITIPPGPGTCVQ
jgi:Right handed beta helix region